MIVPPGKASDVPSGVDLTPGEDIAKAISTKRKNK